ASIPNTTSYAFNSPNTGTEATFEKRAATSIASHVPVDKPHVAFVSTSAQSALATLDRVASVGQYQPSIKYPNNGFGQALRAVAGAMAKGIGTRVFWVQTGGFDTHASQGTTTDGGAYAGLMTTLNDGLAAFYNDVRNLGLLNNTLVLTFSEFGRRIGERAPLHRKYDGRRSCVLTSPTIALVRDTVLVLTHPKDGHSDLVIAELARRGVPLIRFNTEDYPQRATIACSFGEHGARQLLTCDGREHDLGRVKSVWNRRPRSPHVSEDLTATDRAVASEEFT